MNINTAKQIAIDSVRRAGKIIMDNLDKENDLHYKDKRNKRDYTTKIDLMSEELIVSSIKKSFPDHGIISEEMGMRNENSEFVWVLDPIDGTLNYSKALPIFSIGLCLLQNQKPIIGLNYDPLNNNLYFAAKGEGATLNDKKILVSNCDQLDQAMIISHMSSKKEKRQWLIENLDDICDKVLQIRFLGSAHNSQSFVATGQAEAFFEISTFSWDIFPCLLIIEEAGGKVTDLKGGPITLDSTSILATNGKVHNEMLEIFTR